MSAGQWFAPGRTPMHATSSTRWRVTSCVWIEASLTPGMTSKSSKHVGRAGVVFLEHWISSAFLLSQQERSCSDAHAS